MFEEKKLTMELGGRTLEVSTGKIARQAHGAIVIKYGDTTVLTTVTRSKEAKEGIDFFPLTVDFIEKFYSTGKIPGGFHKREARPSVDATLTARVIDRPMRPLFPDGFNYAVHIVNTVLSYDEKNTPDYLGIIASSLAVAISDIPFSGPAAGVVVGYDRETDEFVLNPTPEFLEKNDLNLTLAGTKDAINMVEAGANELSEEKMLEAIEFAHSYIKRICEFQEEFVKLAGNEKIEFIKTEVDANIKEFIDTNGRDKLFTAVKTLGKHAREEAVKELEEELTEKYSENYMKENSVDEVPEEIISDLKKYYYELMKN